MPKRLASLRRIVAVLVVAAVVASVARAAEESTEDLAKKTQNPVADLISVPSQNNFNFNAGPNERSVYVAFFNAERREFDPNWQLRAQVQFLFPK
jgi:cytochrome c oxidase assembly factor CtaG